MDEFEWQAGDYAAVELNEDGRAMIVDPRDGATVILTGWNMDDLCEKWLAYRDQESQRKQVANWNAVADGFAPPHPDEY